MIMRGIILSTLIILMLGLGNVLYGQCDYAFYGVDEFDGTRMAASHTVNVGRLIPSYYETVEGAKIIEECKVFLSYTEEARDTGIVSMFLTLATQEYEFYKIEKAENVLLALSDSTIVGLYNVPESKFDRSTNMRLYTHTCVLPVDIFYKLLIHDIRKVRILYREHKHDIDIYPEQQKALLNQLKCIGRAAGLYPLKP